MLNKMKSGAVLRGLGLFRASGRQTLHRRVENAMLSLACLSPSIMGFSESADAPPVNHRPAKSARFDESGMTEYSPPH
jgi:hypothetical protein